MSAPTTVSTAAVRRFGELSRADVPFAGAKGANLGELAAAGLPVPPGFVVGAPAYAELLVRAGIDAVSVNMDAVDRARRLLAAVEQRVLLEAATARPDRGSVS
jgi:pyruvate, water dikinase